MTSPTDTGVEANVSEVELPENAFVQYEIAERGVVHRIDLDGRYVISTPATGETETKPTSRLEPGVSRVSAAGLDRIRASATEIGFFDLPARVEGPSFEGSVTLDGEAVASEPLVFTLRDGDRVHRVTVFGDPTVPATMGPLEPLFSTLDAEAFGDWLRG